MNDYRLSPSDLTFLWDECKRCFYLKVREKFRRPSAPFPGIFGLIDRLMKDIYLGNSNKKMTNELPEGQAIMSGRWVNSAPIRLPNHDITCSIRGLFDTVVHFEDGSYGIVDFKTTTVKPEHVDFYSRQLRAYAYALEHPMPGQLHAAPITRLGLLCFDPKKMLENEEVGLELAGPATWLECPVDEDAFLGFIDEVMTILENPEAPAADPKCTYCTYRDASRVTGF
jgi:hypothetical protein